MMNSQRGAILITGGAGFIGSHFAELVLKQGTKVAVIDSLTYAGHLENLAHLPEIEFIEGDIRDADLVRRLLGRLGISQVVNFAAETHVDRSIDGPADFIETNVVGTFNLLRSCLAHWEKLPGEQKANFRYVQISTDEVFGSLGAEGKFRESSPFEPNSPYSASKAGADHLVRAWYHTYGFPAITTHCSNNYGSRQYPEKLIPYMIHCALSGHDLGVYGDGANIRDWIHVEDHCRGILLALTKGRPGERYCFGGNEEWRNIDLVKLICRELDRLRPRGDGRKHETAIKFVKDRAGHDQRYAIDDSRARRELGYVPSRTFQEGLAATVGWYVENQEWREKVMRAKK